MTRHFDLRRVLAPVAAALTMAMASLAQTPTPQNGWLWGFSVLGLVVVDRNFNLLGSPGAAAGGGPGADFSVDSGWQIWELSSRVGGPLFYRQFTAPTATAQLAMPTLAWYMTHDRRRVWLVGRDGTLGYIAKTDLNAQAETPAGNVRTALALSQFVGSMCSNGRDLFFSIRVTANDAFHIFAVDTQAAPLTVRPVAAMPLGGTDVRGPDLTLGQNGDLLASYDHAMWSIGAETGVVQQLFAEPADPTFAAGTLQKLIAYDPWTDELATTPEAATVLLIFTRTVTQGAWQFRLGNPFSGAYAFACAAERPFELFGRGCNNSTSRDPRLGWTGMPQPGSSFSIRLRDAEIGGTAVFWLGLSEASWQPVGILPFDLAPYGAPGCRLMVAVDAPVLAPVDPQGRAAATYPVPAIPALVGIDLFAQTLSSSATNALGLATSDAVMIRVR